jgi:hypothetical protein
MYVVRVHRAAGRASVASMRAIVASMLGRSTWERRLAHLWVPQWVPPWLPPWEPRTAVGAAAGAGVGLCIASQDFCVVTAIGIWTPARPLKAGHTRARLTDLPSKPRNKWVGFQRTLHNDLECRRGGQLVSELCFCC